ncbi:succinyldiaminopimelate transaminase [Arthrobacter sp. H41]|uniref:succinyldiaminopimelate transaminase n=1 Tax=Arthrobacter sp. H41 TaxID=1312978 RepID=UPI0004B30098|nr:succinyldiaminopimelate transaminase [Arthrobacter sp. H41]
MTAEPAQPPETRSFGLRLPDYPWDAMRPYVEKAAQHLDGAVNLSIGTPVDPTPGVVREALSAASDAPGYPTTHGTQALREAISAWFARRRGVPGLDPEDILPTVGSKELVAWLPTLLGLGEGDVVVRPRVAYPTYDVGALLAGATPVAADSLAELAPDVRQRVRLVWLNSPSNPTGEVLDAGAMKAVVDEARSLGAVVGSDECYAELGWGSWDPERGGVAVPSVLDPRVAGSSTDLLLAIYSLSKQSNVAGYRAAFVAGDGAILANLVNSRKHAGMIVPFPVQEAMRVALGDDGHVQRQKDLYRSRRERLMPALRSFGMTIHGSDAGLYLWASDGSATWDTVDRFAGKGIVVGPGTFYGDAGNGFVRVALTGTDERIDAAVARLAR